MSFCSSLSFFIFVEKHHELMFFFLNFKKYIYTDIDHMLNRIE